MLSYRSINIVLSVWCLPIYLSHDLTNQILTLLGSQSGVDRLLTNKIIIVLCNVLILQPVSTCNGMHEQSTIGMWKLVGV